MKATHSKFLIIKNKQALFVASISASVIIGLVVLWLINVYSDAFPASYNIQITSPSIGQSWTNDGGNWTECKSLGWSLAASLTTGKPEDIRQFYTRKWNREAILGGMQVRPGVFAHWDSFSLFEWRGMYQNLSAYKQVNYPDSGEQPFRYSVATIISFCSAMN
jgi:hypothetical protein